MTEQDDLYKLLEVFGYGIFLLLGNSTLFENVYNLYIINNKSLLSKKNNKSLLLQFPPF